MSGIPLLVEPAGLRVLIVGGGAVALRKAKQLAQMGAQLRVVAPVVSEELEALLHDRGSTVERREYATGDIDDAQLVFAATNDKLVNAQVASDADAENRLVNVTDLSEGGNFSVMATHHRGALTIGVSAGGVSAAALRIRDAIAERFDARYGDALHELAQLRRRLLASGDTAAWKERSAALIDDDFCDLVEQGRLAQKIAPWP